MTVIFNNYTEETLANEIKYFEKKIQVRNAASKRQKRFKHAVDYFDQDDVYILPEVNIVAGDEICKNLRRCLRIVETLSKQQLMFTEFFIQTLLPFIYGAQFADNIDRIKAENDIERIIQYALVTVARRMGKTLLTAWFVACCMLCIPNFTSAVFSPGKRQSGYFTEIVKDMLMSKGPLTGITFEVIQNNVEALVISVGGNKRLVRGLPAKESTTRGTTAIFTVAEEAAQLPKKFFLSTVLPIASEKNNAFIGITTLVGTHLGKTNWVTKLMALRDKKKAKHFLTYSYSVACDKCIAEHNEENCKHKMGELPPWHSANKQAFNRDVFLCLDEKDLMLQETKGILTSDTNQAFRESLIQRTFTKRNTTVAFDEIREKPTCIFIAVDPTGGGDGSQLAIISLFLDDRGTYVVIGLESIPAKMTRDFIHLIPEHACKIRNTPQYKDVVLVFIVENNNAIGCNDIIDTIRNSPRPELRHNVRFLNKSSYDISNVSLFQGRKKRKMGTDKDGLRTGAEVKKAMLLLTDRVLTLHQVCFMKELISIYKTDERKPETIIAARERVLHLLKQQLINWSIVMKPKTTTKSANFDEVVWTMGGKDSGPDDLATIFQLCLFWSQVYFTNADFQRDLGAF
jgi:hypothetical protein